MADELFTSLVRQATTTTSRTTDGHAPYPYQSRLAEHGLPDLIRVPTGAGKTLAATLPWLYRRRFHPDGDVRRSTPRRLVIVLPQRSLVEQTRDVVQDWLGRLAGSADPMLRLHPSVPVHVLLGGASSDDRLWKMDPAAEAVFVGTQDMVLSRLLMRGYGEWRSAWPIAFGLLHADTQFVFDEVQLMGPGLPTSLQLAGLRRKLGTAADCRSTWMSATADERRFTDLPDFEGLTSEVTLTDDDRVGSLGKVLDATRTVRRLEIDTDPKRYPAQLATAVAGLHRPRSRTLVVLNTVDRAAQVYDALSGHVPGGARVLLHSRFRPGDRTDRMQAAVADPGPDGLIVVATQVLEAGVDITSRLLVTETAPWSSIVQRSGRCNRGGEDRDAEIRWVTPPGSSRHRAAPYDEADLVVTSRALSELEGAAVTGTLLQEQVVEEKVTIHPVLRRTDLLDLFDTTPDLSGNDLDVGCWIRDADIATAEVAWRDYAQAKPPEDAAALSREELCPAPLSSLRELASQAGRRLWLYEQSDDHWRVATREDVRPGVMLLLDAQQGGYRPDRGWAPGSTERVSPVSPVKPESVDGMSTDNLTAVGRAVTLADHADDVRREAALLLDAFGELPGLSPAHRAAAERAGLYHDLGKAHQVFVESLERVGAPVAGGPWAKSPSRTRLRHRPKGFRHELVSALMVLTPDSGLLTGVAEPDLVAYLVAAHHGKVRLAVRSGPTDRDDRMLGVGREERTPSVSLHGGVTVPPLVLHRAVMEIGDSVSGESWSARTCRLRDRDDLGPFRVAFLEAIVTLADRRASRSYEEDQ